MSDDCGTTDNPCGCCKIRILQPNGSRISGFHPDSPMSETTCLATVGQNLPDGVIERASWGIYSTNPTCSGADLPGGGWGDNNFDIDNPLTPGYRLPKDDESDPSLSKRPPELFGLKVSNISASIGWGAQGATCGITLVDESKEGENISAGFPKTGTACGFNFESFSFGGVLQRHTYKESLSGRLYDVALESPAKLLDGVQVIISDFEAGYREGGSYNYLKYEVKNVWNAFAHYENYLYGGGPDDPGGFGKSNVNEGGMPVAELFKALSFFGSNGTLVDGEQIDEDDNDWEAPVFGGKIIYGESEYTIEFTDLANMVMERAPEYRVKGPVQSLNSLINDLCETVQIDYFIQLVAPTTQNGEIDDPHLKVRIVDKSVVSEGIVASLVATEKESGFLISSTVGMELQDSPAGKVLIGGAASRTEIRNIAGSPEARAIWNSSGGAYSIGGSMSTAYTNPHEEIPISLISSASLPAPFQSPFFPITSVTQSYTATLMELRMSLLNGSGNDMRSWMMYKAYQVAAGMEPNGFYAGTSPSQTDSNWYGLLINEANLNNAARIGGPNGGPIGIHNAIMNKGLYTSPGFSGSVAEESLKTLYDSVKRVATTFYGRTFLVPLPVEPGGLNNNLRWIDPEFKTNYEASWEISGSAWCKNRPILDTSFYDSSGRLKPYVAWGGSSFQTMYSTNPTIAPQVGRPGMDFSTLGKEWGVDLYGLTASMKGKPNKDIYWIGGLPYAIIDTGAQVAHWDGWTTGIDGHIILAGLFFGLDVSGGVNVSRHVQALMDWNGKVPDHEVVIPPEMVAPSYAVIPQESTRYSWGPWYAWSGKGKAEVEVDTTMKPETYGNAATMDEVGFGSVYAGLAGTEGIETGTVELAKVPDYNLGDKFAGSGPYVTSMDISVNVEGGIKTGYKFSTWTPSFGKLNKYNADRIARINKASIGFAKSKEREHGALPGHGTPANMPEKPEKTQGVPGQAGNINVNRANQPK